MNLEQQLLIKAVDSILHGHTYTETRVDTEGRVEYQSYRVNDLRVELVKDLANKIYNSPEFSSALQKAVTDDVIRKVQEKAVNAITWNDLPYRFRGALEAKMKEENVRLHKLKITLETVENDPTIDSDNE